MTGIGVILGTAAYMSPEQAKGREADKRSDIWTFGAVLFEMLTARRAFEGEDISDTLANVLKSTPDWTAFPADLPFPIRALIQRCLVRDRRQRIAEMSTALFVMAEGANLAPLATTGGQPAAVVPPPWWRRLLIPVATGIVVGGAAGAGVWLEMRPAASRMTRFAITETGAAALSVDQVSRDLMITPDGTHIVYKGAGTGDGNQLFVRAVDQLEPTPLTGLGIPRAPFSSPDGQWIGFVDISAGGTLKKVALTGGPTVVLCPPGANSRGATWGDDGTIIFATAARATGLQRVSSSGGEPAVLTKPDGERGEADHLWPQFLPGSQAVLFTITATSGGMDASQVAVLDLRSGQQKVLVRGGSQAQYVRTGHLVYVAAGTLRAVAFDLERLETIGTPVPVLSRVVTVPTGTAEFDVARDNGTLVYVGGGAAVVAARTLMWVDRQGHEEAIKGAPARAFVNPRLSPDGTQVAVGVLDQEDDVWVWNGARETFSRVTFDQGLDSSPAWMPDGRRIVYSSQAGGTDGSLFEQAADGTGMPTRLTRAERAQTPSAVSPDGTRVLFSELPEPQSRRGSDVVMLTLGNDLRTQSLLATTFVERNAEISPNGRWVAYQSNESGQYEISVRPFPRVSSGKWQVSVGGGTQPLWARSGNELFYPCA